MKYSKTNPPIQCFMHKSTWYKGAGDMEIKGILIHSTGANNPNLKRYVQPDDDATDKTIMHNLIGKNNNKNDWNHITIQAGVNAFIGKLADGTVSTVQVGPWNKKPWGCGTGKNGSCNNGRVQFECCEDLLKDKNYFDKVYKEIIELTGHLCQLYNLNPTGTVKYNGLNVPVILCHADAYKLGLGSNHSDILHWFNKYNKTMENVRQDVLNLIKPKNTLEDNAKKAILSLANKGYMNSPEYWIKQCKEISNLQHLFIKCDGKLEKFTNKASTVDEGLNQLIKLGIINSPEYWKDLVKKVDWIGDLFKQLGGKKEEIKPPYQVEVTAAALNYRVGPGTNYRILGTIKKGQNYLVTNEFNGWGQLDHSIGWIDLEFVKIIK